LHPTTSGKKAIDRKNPQKTTMIAVNFDINPALKKILMRVKRPV